MTGEPSHILAVGDLHGDAHWACRLIRALPGLLPNEASPLILQVGDFGIWPGPSGQRYLRDLTFALSEVGGQLWFLQGNHENHDWLAARRHPMPDGRVQLTSRIFWLPTGTRWKWRHRTWVTVGGAVSVDRALRSEGVSWWPAEELTDAEADAVIAAGPVDVMLSHDCPSAAPLTLPPWPPEWDIADMARAEAHRDRLQRVVDGVKPMLVIHGHYHLAQDKIVRMGHGTVNVVALDMNGTARNAVVVDVEPPVSIHWVDPMDLALGRPHPFLGLNPDIRR